MPVHKTFHGSTYYRRPTEKIIFSDASWPWSRFREMASTAPNYTEIISEYAVTPLADDGKKTTYSLRPRKGGGRVQELALTVDDRVALIVGAVWSYTNGSKLSFDETYESIGAFRLPLRAKISARFSHYSVDGTLELSDYKPNARIPASVVLLSSDRSRFDLRAKLGTEPCCQVTVGRQRKRFTVRSVATQSTARFPSIGSRYDMKISRAPT
jgi:hypothetical protein